jgi:hypothetical protein
MEVSNNTMVNNECQYSTTQISVQLYWHSLFTIVLEWKHNGIDNIKINVQEVWK